MRSIETNRSTSACFSKRNMHAYAPDREERVPFVCVLRRLNRSARTLVSKVVRRPTCESFAPSTGSNFEEGKSLAHILSAQKVPLRTSHALFDTGKKNGGLHATVWPLESLSRSPCHGAKAPQRKRFKQKNESTPRSYDWCTTLAGILKHAVIVLVGWWIANFGRTVSTSR